MIILLIIASFLLLCICVTQIAVCMLLVKLSEQIGTLWTSSQVQEENLSILLNWVGGVQKNQQ
jgi:type IV secretory pathway VirB3-like protein